MKKIIVLLAAGVSLLPSLAIGGSGSTGTFVNFESSQINPVRLSADQTRLFVVDTPDARVSVFDVSNPSKPVLLTEIPVGIEPVSVNVNPNNSDELWVVNQVSNSVSVVSISKQIVTDTIAAKPEPADVVFANNQAWVSISRAYLQTSGPYNGQYISTINVYDLTTHALVNAIPVFGGSPRSMAVSPDGSKVYAAFALSGNATTIIPVPQAPAPPPPTNSKLPPAPPQGIIVKYNDPSWSSFIQFTMPDNDVVQINAATQSVDRYYSGVGTINLGLAVNPKTGDLYVANTDALNYGPQFRFEENLRGHFVNNQMTQILISNGQVTAYDLNPGINYVKLPNPQALSTAVAQPTATVFDPSGNFMWTAAFGTDRVAKVSTGGSVLQRIELGNTPGPKVDPQHKRGPRGLALNASAGILYVLNRISNTLSVVSTSAGSVLSEMPVGAYDPTPSVIVNGRGFLYDAKLSGNGTAACAACHIDGDMDHVVWDLGDPDGDLYQISAPVPVTLHPMKGPMTTLALKGLENVEPYHWRGDKASFLNFDIAFNNLMGGSQISNAEMTAYEDFINTIKFVPNPNQNLDRSLPTSLAGGSPVEGQNIFRQTPFEAGILTCGLCHLFPGSGTDRQIIPGILLLQPQAFKVPQIRNMYQKLLFNNAAGQQTIDGIGLLHDGSKAGSFEFLSDPVFGSFANNVEIQTQLNSFMQCFDTGMAPAVGYTRTVTQANVNTSSITSDWATLESQAAASNNDLIGKGTINKQLHGLLYQSSTGMYETDTPGLGPYSHQQLVQFIQNGDTISIMGVPFGSGWRMGIGRNGVILDSGHK